MKSIVQLVMFYHSAIVLLTNWLRGSLEGIVSQGSLLSASQKKVEEYLLN